ncbi:iron-sulfur cluster assembly scaffold protein [Paracoccus panacisoli]|uniref:Iron-sulfur cluster assembly scaffold protein n=1 Tax=Paracoccus panacisoli TaxID=1510163 RepID=A0ABV6T681_9RHOB
MADDDLMALYSRRLLALAADIPHLGRLDAPQGSASFRSPQCGSTVTADVVLADGRVVGFAQEVRACALGQASAAVLGGAVMGRTPAELARARDALRAMLAEAAAPPAPPFDGAEALLAAREFPNRHASILLAWQAAAEAAEEAAAAAGDTRE